MRLEIARALLRVNGPDDRTAADILTGLVADPEPVSDRSLAMDVLLHAGERDPEPGMLALAERYPMPIPWSSRTCSPAWAKLVLEPVLRCALENCWMILNPPRGPAAIRAILQIEASDNPPESGMMGSAVKDVPGSGPLKNPRLTAVMLETIADRSWIMISAWRC